MRTQNTQNIDNDNNERSEHDLQALTACDDANEDRLLTTDEVVAIAKKHNNSRLDLLGTIFARDSITEEYYSEDDVLEKIQDWEQFLDSCDQYWREITGE